MFADSDLHQLFQRSEARACLYTGAGVWHERFISNRGRGVCL